MRDGGKEWEMESKDNEARKNRTSIGGGEEGNRGYVIGKGWTRATESLKNRRE